MKQDYRIFRIAGLAIMLVSLARLCARPGAVEAIAAVAPTAVMASGVFLITCFVAALALVAIRRGWREHG